jgi:hypothetical protein
MLAAPLAAQTRDAATAELQSGHRLAEAMAIATGAPLLGVSGLGAYRWWTTPEPLRAALPWYSRPAFWGTGLFLAFLFAANTTVGAALPGLKKPMDFVEHFENQASALLASPIVLLEVHRLLSSGSGGSEVTASLAAAPSLAGAGVAALAGGELPALLAPFATLGSSALALFAYVLVFLAFHTIQVLIALSPSAILDMMLRLFRLAVIGFAGVAAAVHPYFGALFGLLLVTVALLVAGWSFRLFVFGTVFGRDLLFAHAPAAASPLVGFAGGALAGVPIRSYGRVEGDALAGWRFVWRPWLVLPLRAAPLPTKLAIRRGFLSPTLFLAGVVREPVAVRFPPRFKGSEEALARRLDVADVREGRIVRGVKAAWAWLRSLVFGREGAGEPVV